MIASLALWLLRRTAPAWLTAPVKWLIDAAMILAVLGGIYAWIYHRGEAAGGAKVTKSTAVQHAKTVAEGVADTGKAQATADAIADRVTRIDTTTTDFVRAKIKETDDAIDVPPAPAGAPPALVDTSSVSASVNALVDRANGEAEAADAES